MRPPNTAGYTPMGLRIHEARLRAGLSQSELADRVGISEATLVRAKKGETTLHFYNAIKLAEALCISLDYLAGRDVPAPEDHSAELAAAREEISRLTAALEAEKAARSADADNHHRLQSQRHDYLRIKDRYIAISVALLSLSILTNVLLAILL